MPLLTDISVLATCPPDGEQHDIGTIEHAAIVWRDDEFLWVGKEAGLPEEYANEPRESAGGSLVIPGLIDCHTHLAFGGWRADEFELRIKGAGYLEIARAGGGIASTMRQTRAASEGELVKRGAGFLAEMRRLGVTMVEAKSGYGLSEADELKTLRAYRRLSERQPTRLASTFLGAHIIPPEYRDRREDYIELLTDRLLPTVAAEELAAFCDVFVEDTAFTAHEARAILGAAAEHGLGAKLHVDQLTDGGGAALAAEMNAVSADHLEYTNAEGVEAMAAAGTVAVALPLATLYLNVDPMPARRFIEAGVPVAVATDFNPGSAPSYDLPLALLLACTMLRMTPAEALKGATTIAARAIREEKTVGSVLPGMKADFAVIDAPDVNHWLYHFRPNACVRTVIGGKTVWHA